MNSHPILLVAGPSGGGKSTFIQQLAEGTLAPELLALLPGVSREWPVIEANNVLKGDLAADEFQARLRTGGCVVHYDIVFIHHRGLHRYEDDPAIRLLADAGPLTAVTVRADAARLRRQFLDRKERHLQSKSIASRWWRRFVRTPLKRAVARLTGRQTTATEDFYETAGWIESCHAEWEAAVYRLTGTQPILIEPADGAQRGIAFRRVGPAECGSPPNVS